MPGAEENGLAPTWIVQVGLKHGPAFIGFEAGERPAGEVFLEGEVEKAEGVVASGDEKTRHLPHFAEEVAS